MPASTILQFRTSLSASSCAISDLIFRLYTSVDPAPPSSNLLLGDLNPEDVSEAGVERLRKDLIDPNLPLFQRYRAMFALRNIGTPAAVDALASGFSDESALFK